MYAITREGKSFGPDGLIQDMEGTPLAAQDADAYNKALEAQELASIKTGPDKLFLYVKTVDTTEESWQKALASGWTPETTERKHWQSSRVDVGTWLGTRVSDWVSLGTKSYIGFGGAYRRSVSCSIFGVKYHGWYMESSGDYCRLTKSKKQ